MKTFKNLFLISTFFLLLNGILHAKSKPLNILIFHSYHQTLPWTQEVLSGLDKFKKNYDGEINFYLESVDSIRLESQMRSEEWETYLKNKYKDLHFDGILIETIFAAKIYDSISSDFYPDTPKIYFADILVSNKKHSKSVLEQEATIVQKTITLAQMHNPNLKTVYVIKSDTPAKKLENLLLNELKNRKLETVYIENFTIEELQIKLSKLPKNSAVFYGINFYDKDGKTYSAKVFLEKIIKYSNTPVYSFYNTFLGTGTIGGYMIDAETAIHEILKSLLHYIEYKSFNENEKTYNLFIDYEVLKKYNIKQSNNPSNAIFVNQPVPIWKIYPNETFLALGIIVLLVLLLLLTFILKIRNERILSMEEHMFIQSKQAAMGEMMSVIAHQWRQPLNNISVMVQTILLKYKKDKLDELMMTKFKTDILKQIHYMSKIVDDFKFFYKPNKEKRKFDIREELVKTIELIEIAYVKDGIIIEQNIQDSYEIYAYENELTHCFLVILQNAQDVLKKSSSEQKRITIESKIKNDELVISFYNNGELIPKEIKEKIFKPYFSTKKEKNGTGIGLYMAQTIIEKHFNGSITATNTHNGVVFEIKISQ